MKQRYYKCETCGKIVAVVKDSAVPVMCCGQAMKEMIPGTTDAAVEKHVPAVSVEGNKVVVNVGEVAHPMIDAHYIEWVSIETNLGSQMKVLAPDMEPAVCFSLCDNEKVEAVYAYCNLHGLWKKEV